MKIAIGHRETTTGYIEMTPQGLVFSSDIGYEHILEGEVNSLRHSYPNWSDEDVIKWYLRRGGNPYGWAFAVPDGKKD